MKKVLSIFILLFMIAKGVAQVNHKLHIEFDNIGYDSGNLYVGLYNSENDFLKNEFRSVKVTVTNGKSSAVFSNLKSGIYAVSAFYDKNNNKKLDTNFLRIPKEPTVMSNNAKGSFGPPKFEDAKFKIIGDTSIKLVF